MKIFKFFTLTLVFVYFSLGNSEEYSAPELKLSERETVEIDEDAHNSRGLLSEINKERSPSSSAQQQRPEQLEHWKIQEIIDRYDEH